MEGYTKQWFVAINRVFHAYKFSWHCNILVLMSISEKWNTTLLIIQTNEKLCSYIAFMTYSP